MFCARNDESGKVWTDRDSVLPSGDVAICSNQRDQRLSNQERFKNASDPKQIHNQNNTQMLRCPLSYFMHLLVLTSYFACSRTNFEWNFNWTRERRRIWWFTATSSEGVEAKERDAATGHNNPHQTRDTDVSSLSATSCFLWISFYSLCWRVTSLQFVSNLNNANIETNEQQQPIQQSHRSNRNMFIHH